VSRRIDLVFPRFKILSGAERLILELAAGLARAGHRPRLVAHRFDDSCLELLAPGVELETTDLRLDWTGNRYLDAMFDYARAGALYRRIDPTADAVVLYGPALGLAPRLLRRAAPRPAVVYHCFEPPRALYQDRGDVLARAGILALPLGIALSAYRRIDRRLVARAEAVTASGPFAAGRVREAYGRNAVPITHGLARARLDAAVATPEPNPLAIVTVNYLHPRKRIDLVIRALAQLPEALAATTLEVVGDGPERSLLAALADDLGVGARVRFAGFVPEAQLGAHYRRASCYVHAAREESFGLSVIEAAYCGLPIVAVAEGGVVDNVRDGQTGRLVEPSPEALAAGIADVLERPGRGRALGAAGRQLVDAHYRWELGVQDLLGAIERAQAARDSARAPVRP
jgi:glycosyltransferase involved in cell wall biosynthesis